MNILSNIPVHEAAHGFTQGRSVISNAQIHLGNESVLKLDLKDFFPSIQFRRGVKIFVNAGYPPIVSYCLASICFKNGYLPQGAATSPSLSNIVAKRLEVHLSKLAEENNLFYSRYADDIVFSGRSISVNLLDTVDDFVRRQGFALNHSKTQLITGNTKKIITGISISSGKLALPRKSIRDIKQQAHYLLKFGYFAHSKNIGKQDPILIERLLGRIGFWLQVDPENKTARRLQVDKFSYKKTFDSELSKYKIENHKTG